MGCWSGTHALILWELVGADEVLWRSKISPVFDLSLADQNTLAAQAVAAQALLNGRHRSISVKRSKPLESVLSSNCRLVTDGLSMSNWSVTNWRVQNKRRLGSACLHSCGYKYVYSLLDSSKSRWSMPKLLQ